MTITSKSANKDSTNNNKKLDSTSGESNNKKTKDNQQLVSNSKNDIKGGTDSSSLTKTSSSSSTTTTTTTTNTNNNVFEADKYKRFENEGVVFKAKLIGSELVMEPRGDKMCQNSIQRLKAIIKGTNSHKKRIVLKISYDGVKVYDEKTNEILHHHEVSQISYISSDDTDNRTFGYVSDVPNKAHQFICFKTSGPAISVMSVISALFEAVLEKKKKAEKEKSLEGVIGTGGDDTGNAITKIIDDIDSTEHVSSSKEEQTIDLIGDSGIIDGGDVSVFAHDDISRNLSTSQIGLTNANLSLSTTNPTMNTSQVHKRLQSSLSILENNITLPSPGHSFNISNSQQHFNQSLNSNNNNQQNSLGKIGKQSTMSSDLIFDDLFAGLSDPIIVDKNDSLIINSQQQQHLEGPQQQQQQQQQQQPPPPFPIPKRRNPSVLLPPPSSLPRPGGMLGQQSGTGGPGNVSATSHNRSLVYNHSSVSLSDAALTRQSSFNSTSNNNAHNDSSNNVDRYAVFNDIDSLPSIFESTSLGSVNKINQQPPPLLPTQQQQQQNQQQHHQQQPLLSQTGININNNNNNFNFNNNYSINNNSNSNNFNTQTNNFGGASFAGTGISSNNSSCFDDLNPIGPSFGTTGTGSGRAGSGTILAQQQSTSSINIDQQTNKSNMFQRQQTNPFDDDFFA